MLVGWESSYHHILIFQFIVKIMIIIDNKIKCIYVDSRVHIRIYYEIIGNYGNVSNTPINNFN